MKEIKDIEVKVDSGHAGEKFTEEIYGKYPHVEVNVCARTYRNTPLTDDDKARRR